MDGDLRFLGHAKREVQFLVLLHSFAADMSDVDDAGRCRHLREREHFVRILRPAAFESGDEPPCAFLHRPRSELHHALQLRGRCGSSGIAHHDQSNLLVGHLRDDVHGDALLSKGLPVAGEVGPAPLRRGQPVSRGD